MSESAEQEKRRGTAGRSTVLAWKASAAALSVIVICWVGSRIRASDDTWMALAAGRLICERGYFDFPLADEFSFTFAGQVWTNQNWLSDVIYWWVYHYWCPSGLVALKLGLTVLLGLAAWRSALLLSRDHPISLLAACGCLLLAADFLDIRPNLVGLLCLSVLYWTLLGLKHGRKWAVWLIPPLMAFWGNAHGSFLFGYVMLIVFLCAEAGQRLVGRRVAITSARQLLQLSFATLLSGVLVTITSPYHLSNFTHPLVIMTGKDRDIFQAIYEWHSPLTLPLHLPQVTGLWTLLALSASIWIAAAIRGRASLPGGDQPTTSTGSRFDATEVLLAVLGLYLGIKHLRFVPLFVFLSLPVTAKLLAVCVRRRQAPPANRTHCHPLPRAQALIGITCLNAALIVYLGGVRAGDLKQAYLPDSEEPYATWLFHQHIIHQADPTELVDFASRQGLSGPIYNEWSWGGYLMFHAPQFKLFIDGRAQALYNADHCQWYFRLKNDPAQDMRPVATRGRQLDRRLAGLGVNLLLGKRTSPWASRIVKPLLATPYWHPLFETDDGVLLVNGVSEDPQIIKLMRRYWAGELDWPDTPHGWRIRGYVWQNGPRPDYGRAVEAYRRAAQLAPQPWLYQRLANCWRQTGRPEEARTYFEKERLRLGDMAATATHQAGQLTECVQTLDRILAAWDPSAPDRQDRARPENSPHKS